MRAFWKTSPRLGGVALATVVLALALLSIRGPAYADNNDLIDPDDVTHYVDRNALTSDGNLAALRGIAELDTTKMNATLDGSGDVEVYDASYGTSGSWNNTRGRATCVNKTWTGLECDVWEVRFNQSYLDSQSLANWWHVGCHEFGHTAGISHRDADDDTNNNSCMRSGGSNYFLDNHDVAVINDDV